MRIALNNGRILPFAGVAALVCLLGGCSSSPTPPLAQHGYEAPSGPPVRPKRGEAIDVFEFHRYLESQALALLHQNRLATNLSIRAAPRKCRLELASPRTDPLSPAQLAEASEMAVTVVATLAKAKKTFSLDGIATGFFLTESGALVTCRHVFAEPRTVGVVVMTRDGLVCPVRQVLAVDSTNDLIVVQVEGRGFTPLAVARGARQGAPICVLSHPEWRFYTLSTGVISSYSRWPREEGEGQRLWMSITADFAVGSSGAPVLNDCGAVVGIAAETAAIFPTEKSDQAQMIEKLCVPSSLLLNLVAPE
jgi:S1-C subfamily serine protease